MTKRWPPLVLIAALLVGGLVVGRDGSGRDTSAIGPVDPATLLPVAAPLDALDGSWFCAGQSAGDDTPADGTLVLANVGDTDAVTRVQVVAAGEGDDPVVERVEVPARTTERVRVADLLEADWAAAQVQVAGGTVVVEHEVVGEHGRDVAPCSSRASDRWLLPTGASTRDAALTLAVYNPYPGEARVDLRFQTDDGVREPTDLQGLRIAPGALVAVDVAAVVTERATIATIVEATRGQVVVDRIQTYDGQGSATTDEEAEAETFLREGLTLTPGVPSARRVWAFPAGVRAAFLHERVLVFNPGDEAAEVVVDIALDDPLRNGVLDAFPLTVPPGEVAVLDVDDLETVPLGITHSISVRAENDVPVVAERSIAAAGDVADDEPAPYLGEATSTGSPLAAERWAFAAGAEPGAEAGHIVVSNPGDDAVQVELVAFGDGETSPALVDEDGEPVASFALEPGARREVVVAADLPEGRTSVEVVADGPVVAERRLLAERTTAGSDEEGSTTEPGRGTSTALGIPLRRGLVVLE